MVQPVASPSSSSNTRARARARGLARKHDGPASRTLIKFVIYQAGSFGSLNNSLTDSRYAAAVSIGWVNNIMHFAHTNSYRRGVQIEIILIDVRNPHDRRIYRLCGGGCLLTCRGAFVVLIRF